MSGDLWAVHTLGMDDLHPCASRVLAVRNATWLNLSLERALEDMGDESYPLIYNIPVLWDGTEAGHAEALAASVAEDSRWSDLGADVIGDLARGVYANPVAATEAEAVRSKAATVDRGAASEMTAREVCQKLTEAYTGDRQTAGEAAELDYAESLMDALDEELRELRGERDRLNDLASRVPETQEQRPTATAMLTAWLDDQEAESAKLREFARQVAPVILEEFKPVAEDGEIMPWMEAHLDVEVLDKLTELAEDLAPGWEARA